jgi:hypothetical protein
LPAPPAHNRRHAEEGGALRDALEALERYVLDIEGIPFSIREELDRRICVILNDLASHPPEAETTGLREQIARCTDVLGDAETIIRLLAGYVDDEQDVREEIDDEEAIVESLRIVQARIKQVRRENRAIHNNDLARRFSGPEGDAAAAALATRPAETQEDAK